MGAFTPFKRHANSFKYTPRYYDPTKEARERRREELYGDRSDLRDEEYRPGDYIRRSSAARAERRGAGAKGVGRGRLLLTLGVVVVLFFLGSVLFSRVVSLLEDGAKGVATTEEEFDPYAPIVIVPNDYVEGAE